METSKEQDNVERAMPAISSVGSCVNCSVCNSRCANDVQRKETRIVHIACATEKEREALIGMASAMFG